MRRYLLSLAVSAAIVTPIVADYLVIRINLGSGVVEQTAGNAGGAPGGGLSAGAGGGLGGGNRGGGKSGMSGPTGPGGPGGGLGAGGPGLGAGAGGGAGLGAGGPGLGAGGGAGIGPGAGPGRGQGSGGAPTGPGGPGTGGGLGAGGGPGAGGGLGFGSGGSGGPPGGGRGRGGLGAGGGQGIMGSGLGGGAGGGLGLGAGPGGGLNGPGNNSNADVPAGLVTNKGDLFIVATEVVVSKQPRSGNVVISHKWGTTVLNPETFLPERATMQVIKVGNLDSRYKTKRHEYLDSGTKQYMKLADWMLENWNMPAEGRFSMQSTFEAYLNELNSLSANLSANDKAKVDALLAVKSQIGKPAAAPKEELDLVKALLPKIGKDFKSLARGHFVIYYSPRDDKLAEAKLARMENAYNGILYWFALQGKPLPVPAKQMVCILADNNDRFKEIHKMFDEAPLYSDGFYSTLDNITVLAPSRVDPGFDKFFQMAKDAETALKSHGLDFKKLLNERTDRPSVNQSRDDAQKVNDVVTGQIYAIALNAAIEEGENATATMETFRQICASTGYMPRSVLLPNWVKEGLSGIFATPKSSGDHNLPSLWSGIGGEHWLHLPLFRKMAAAREAGDSAAITVDEKLPTRHSVKIGKLDVMAVVTDRVYERAEKASKEDKSFMTQKAQAESWALTYYLLKNRSAELKKFYDELTQMPRDLELSPEVLEQAFGRAFELFDASGEKLDKAKVEKLESDWAKYMKYAILTVETAEKSK